jgi:cobalt-zinc-cadmium efflux system membrane fusion protein
MKIVALIAVGLAIAGCSSKPAAVVEGQRETQSAPQVSVDAQTQQQLGVEVQPAVARSVVAPITATGQLQLNEDRTWHVGADTEGRIVSVPVHLGETVKAGQILAQMHSHEVHDSRADRRQAVAELDRVKVMAEQALRVRDRTRRLFDLKAASREQLEAAETQYKSALLSVSTAQAGVDKANAHLTEFLEVPLHDDPAASGRADTDRVPIKAPASGTVMERLASVGSVVSSGDPVVTVSDLSSLWLIAAVNEADLSKIRRGQRVLILVRAYPDRTFPGQVFQLGERLDVQTRSLQVRVLVSNLHGLLKPDMFATAEFSPQTEQTFVHVPESAVQEFKWKSVVFVQTAPGTFIPREVTVGARVDRQIQILSGLEAGTPVVVNGALLLKGQLLKSATD